MPSYIAKDIARLIRASGFECPEVRAAYHMGSDERGNIMRVVCGHINGAAIETPTFRIHVADDWRGTARVTLWEQ